ncbi:MAG TPA: peptide chain release factor 2 [Anaerolineales bacterium]
MNSEDLITELKRSQDRIQELLVRLDFPAKETQLAQLQRASEDPKLWEDQQSASSAMRRLARLREEVETWKSLRQRISDGLELASLQDDSLHAELDTEVRAIWDRLDQLELAAMFSGPYDADPAILAISAGAGGTDSQDWAQMLERMYLRWSEAHEFKTEILDRSEGEEAGIKSVTIAVAGEYAYGYLRAEKGVHRLVRISPFDSARRRHTSFAQVEVLPQVETESEIEINPADLRVDTYRSGGAGGQNVQKNETAIRITHLPTGIVVTCQNERSQSQNRQNAMRVLKARLVDVEREKREQELAKLKGDHMKAEWGSQIRSYVLHPYQMVKDHRTEFEAGNAQAVLDGELDGFIEAYLRHTLGSRVDGKAQAPPA